MVLVSFMAPLAIVSPLAVVFVDRWPLKRTMIASDLIRGVLALVFVHHLYAIYAILFTMSVVSAFFVPAQSVAVRTLIPMAGLTAVNGLMAQAQQGSLIVAPSVAGELVELAGANSCFLYDSFSFFFSAALVMTLTIDRQTSRTESSAVLNSMRQGFGFIFRHSTISFVILAMTAGMFAMRCFGALLSIYVRDSLHSTSAAFGVLNTLIGIGLMSLVAGSQVISMFVAGPVAEKIGIPHRYYGSAAMLIGIGVVGHFQLPKVEKGDSAAAG